MMLQHAVRAKIMKLPDVVYLVTSSGTGSYTAPAGYSKVTIEAIAGGGNGYGNASATYRASGGGGAYARTENLSVTGGSTVVYYSVGGAATNSWVRVGTNSAPSSTSDGCLADGGDSGTLADPGRGAGGSTANSIGTAKYAGADGVRDESASGGGAGGQDAAGSGTTGGGSGDMKGGDGGTYSSDGTAGNAPGGGASSRATPGTPAGGIGRVRITFKHY